ncbi:MAG: hypothetical protein JRC92_05810 [Deltaproteobacteria bacterium]|nr:hypothetical protein [Deltaproteobacteria bacterium]
MGAVFTINDRIVGLKCFSFHDTMTRFFDKLVKSYALDAIDWLDQGKGDGVRPDKVRRFLTSVGKSKGEGHPSVGVGTSVRFESRTVSGAALVEEERVLHLSAFRKKDSADSRGPGFERFSRRRRNQ